MGIDVKMCIRDRSNDLVVNTILDDTTTTISEEYLTPLRDLLTYLIEASLTKYQFGGIAKYKVLHILSLIHI